MKKLYKLGVIFALLLSSVFNIAAYKVSAQEAKLTPGTYEVETPGFGGKMLVEVTLDEDSIVDIQVRDNFETEGVGRVAVHLTAGDIIFAQSTEVDVVTGASVSSHAVKRAVRQALEEAGATDDMFSDPVEPAEYASEREADVVIVGGGGAGLAAAVSAGEAGVSVIVIESNGFAGGNLVVSGGVYNSPDPVKQPEQGIEDSPELFAQQTLEGGDNIGDPKLVQYMAEEAYPGLEWLRSLGIEFIDEIIQAPGALHPRSHNTTAALGTGIINGYLENIEAMDNVEILYNTKGESLIQSDEGEVVGVLATNPDGSDLTLHAHHGVILATGGFSKNPDLVLEYADNEKWPQLDENTVSTNMDSIQGDGIRMGLEVGAGLVDMEQMQFLYLGAPKTGLLSGVYNVSAEIVVFVNQEGERFVAEDERRDVISSAVFDQTDGMMWMVHSADSLSDPASDLNIDGIPMKELLDSGAYGWVQGETIEELAQAMEVPAETLKETIETYNQAVENGNDPFGRQLLTQKIETGPFYALPRVPSLHHTMGGLKIDAQAHVLDEAGEMIPGLYAAGEVVGGIHGGNRLGGNAVTDTVVFGRLAGVSAAADK